VGIRGSCPTTIWITWTAQASRPTITAAELCTCGMWRRVDSGYRVFRTGRAEQADVIEGVFE
jgi:hypothetical protein